MPPATATPTCSVLRSSQNRPDLSNCLLSCASSLPPPKSRPASRRPPRQLDGTRAPSWAPPASTARHRSCRAFRRVRSVLHRSLRIEKQYVTYLASILAKRPWTMARSLSRRRARTSLRAVIGGGQPRSRDRRVAVARRVGGGSRVGAVGRAATGRTSPNQGKHSQCRLLQRISYGQPGRV